MGKYVGIDLGTTFSVIAYIDADGNPQVLSNNEGQNITPSAVLFDGDSVIVGADAKSESYTNADHYVAFAKREMGNVNKKFTIDGDKYTPETISALILKKLKTDAEAVLDDTIEGAVITVPAYFTDVSRKATMDAAEIAGINVLGIINEPTAAALAYGLTKSQEKTKKILVYDLGGGTFDVSIMQLDDERIEILSSVGDSHLGGYDFDKIIVDMFIDAADEQGINVEDDMQARQQLQIRAEEIKKAFSAGRSKQRLSIPVNGKNVTVEISKEDYDAELEPYIFRTVGMMDRALEEAGMEYSDLDKILLVGGSTRIPLVRSMLQEETNITPSMDIHPDEAVAIGAAFHAAKIAQESVKTTVNSVLKKTETSQNNGQNVKKEPFVVKPEDIPVVKKKIEFIDRTTHGIGIQIWDEDMGVDKNSVILPKNTPLPAEASRDFITLMDFQEAIDVKILQGEYEEIQYATVIGESSLRLRPKPKGSPVRVVISCDINAIIHVSISDLTDNENLGEMSIDRSSNMSADEKEEAHRKIGKLNIGME